MMRSSCSPRSPLAVFLRIAFLMASVVVALPVWAQGGAQGASQGERTRLAPPGPCAEPREALAGGASSGTSVIGEIASLFNPVDVAAGPVAAPAQAPPVAGAIVRPGPCDQPGAGCVPQRPPANPPVTPGGRPGKR